MGPTSPHYSSTSVGLEVVPPTSSRSSGLVCYTRSSDPTPTSPLGPATPGPEDLEPVSVFPDTPVAGPKDRTLRHPRQMAQPSRHSARLARSRAGDEVLEPTVTEQAERRVAARNLDLGFLHLPKNKQLELQRDGSKRDENGDGAEDAAVDDDEDDALASNDPCSSDDDALLQVPPPDPFWSWEVIIVYGPADHSRSRTFFDELRAKIDRCTTPVVVASDFNLIRSPEDKSSANVDILRMRMFNDCIADLALREITRVGAWYTWSNNRTSPVQSVLDRVFVLVEWEMAFPLCSFQAAMRIGSDHSPLLLCSGGSSPPRMNRFHFKNLWLGSRVSWRQFTSNGR
ncbi:hypothetical protein ACQ4PT_035357 [Festuca glaucescens]